MTKRIISLCLALVLTLSLIPFAAADNAGLHNFKKEFIFGTNTFTDVPAGQWYTENVQLAYELGLMKGASATTFNPNGNITIAEAIALAARLFDIYNGGSGLFDQGDVWYQVYVDYAIDHEIIGKDEYSNFSAVATRAQFASIFAKALPETALKAINDLTDEIPDVAPTAAIAKAVYLLYNAGILTGSDVYGTFNANSHIMRSEVSAIVTRMADESLRQVLKLVSKDAPAEKDDPKDKDDKEPSAWETLTENDRVNFNTFLSVFSDALECVNNATEQIEVIAGSELPAPLEPMILCQDYLTAAYEYFTIMSLCCEGYSYMNEAKELCDQAASVIEPFLDVPITERDTDQLDFLTNFTHCATGVATIIGMLSDEVTTLSDMFTE